MIYTQEELDIMDGAIPVAMIARIFGLKTSVVRLKLQGVAPYAKKGKEPVYRLRDVAPYLTDLPENVVEQVMRLNHMDLPPMLRKEYWLGQQSRLKVKELEGDLWQTEAVIEYVSEAFKAIRMSVLLAGDALERSTALTDRQRDEVKAILDNLLGDIQGRLSAAFKRKRTDPKGKPGAAHNASAGSSIAEQVADL